MTELTPPAVILDKPQMADNIGSVARVMANFGLVDLRLVAPRDGWPQDRAWATASGADWVLEGVRVFGTVAEAIADGIRAMPVIREHPAWWCFLTGDGHHAHDGPGPQRATATPSHRPPPITQVITSRCAPRARRPACSMTTPPRA